MAKNDDEIPSRYTHRQRDRCICICFCICAQLYAHIAARPPPCPPDGLVLLALCAWLPASACLPLPACWPDGWMCMNVCMYIMHVCAYMDIYKFFYISKYSR